MKKVTLSFTNSIYEENQYKPFLLLSCIGEWFNEDEETFILNSINKIGNEKNQFFIKFTILDEKRFLITNKTSQYNSIIELHLNKKSQVIANYPDYSMKLVSLLTSIKRKTGEIELEYELFHEESKLNKYCLKLTYQEVISNGK